MTRVVWTQNAVDELLARLNAGREVDPTSLDTLGGGLIQPQEQLAGSLTEYGQLTGDVATGTTATIDALDSDGNNQGTIEDVLNGTTQTLVNGTIVWVFDIGPNKMMFPAELEACAGGTVTP